MREKNEYGGKIKLISQGPINVYECLKFIFQFVLNFYTS